MSNDTVGITIFTMLLHPMKKKSSRQALFPVSETTKVNKVGMLCSAGQETVANFLLQLDLRITTFVVY